MSACVIVTCIYLHLRLYIVKTTDSCYDRMVVNSTSRRDPNDLFLFLGTKAYNPPRNILFSFMLFMYNCEAPSCFVSPTQKCGYRLK